MTDKITPYQPGAILHDAIMGAFRANGRTLEEWCRKNNVAPSVARNSTYGQMRGARGQAMLARLIEEAGPEVTKVGYETRLLAHVKEINLGAT